MKPKFKIGQKVVLLDYGRTGTILSVEYELYSLVNEYVYDVRIKGTTNSINSFLRESEMIPAGELSEIIYT